MRVSGGKVDVIIANLGFQCYHRVEVVGYFRGYLDWMEGYCYG